jgi:hypothetical protein
VIQAIPKTPLYARLKNEGRLDLEYEQPFGTNVIRSYAGSIAVLWLPCSADPGLLFICVIKCAMHYHHYTMSCQMAEQRSLVNTF